MDSGKAALLDYPVDCRFVCPLVVNIVRCTFWTASNLPSSRLRRGVRYVDARHSDSIDDIPTKK